MKILFATAEAYPLAKVGGLGDVAGSLPKALIALGHDVRIVMPRYGTIKGPHEEGAQFTVQLGDERSDAGLRTTRIGEVPVYLVDKPDLYDRPKVYEYDDDGKRFGFFCKAILDLLPAADFWPDVIHSNDWHSALVPAFLRSRYAHDSRFQRIGTVLDYAYFVQKVEPILGTPGPDGKACVMCHATHVIFKLKPPNNEGSFSSPDSRENYRYAMRVVDINNPQRSLILIKPTRPTDAGGDVSDYYATHNGGQRWKGNESGWQYKTILEWIRGARLDSAQQRQRASGGGR